MCLCQPPTVDPCRPRRPSEAGVVVYHKINGRVADPRTGERLRRGNRALTSNARPRTVSFGAVALTAFIGFRVAQLLTRVFRRQRQPSQLEQHLLLQQQLEQQQQQMPPPVVRFSRSSGHHTHYCCWHYSRNRLGCVKPHVRLCTAVRQHFVNSADTGVIIFQC